MSFSADLSFVKQFEREVHEAYQRQGSLLRGTVRTKNGVKGSSTTFQRVGKGAATQKARHGPVPPMNVDHTPVECPLEDWYASDWVDRLDELKEAHDERGVLARAGAWGLGRKTDELVITAATATTNTVSGVGLISKSRVLEALETMNAGGVPNDGQRYALVTPHQWSEMLNTVPEFASSDYVDGHPFVNGYEARKWLGAVWMIHTGLSGTGGATASCLFYHKNAIGHAVGADVRSDVWWDGDRQAHKVTNSMSQGACLIDADGVVKMTTDDTAALT